MDKNSGAPEQARCSGVSGIRWASVAGMAGWEVSRHPEWDLMYEAGLTVREISGRCDQKRNTIHLHLQVREQYQPGLRARHEAAFAARDPDSPTTAWRRRMKETENFLATHGRLPQYDGDPIEKSLHTWLSEQRRTHHRGTLSTPKRVLLDSLPGWDASSRQLELDQQWLTRLTQFKDYIAATGQLPRYKNYETEHEHTLGVWLHVQHQKRAEKTLRPSRLEELNATYPDWRSHT